MICSAIYSISLRWPSRNAVGTRLAMALCVNKIAIATLFMPVHAFAQLPLSLTAAAGLAARHAPTVDVGTLLAFAWFESKFQLLAIHDNTAMRSEFPASERRQSHEPRRCWVKITASIWDSVR